MKLTLFTGKVADFEDANLAELFREYLERETNMPYDVIDYYVSDYIACARFEREFKRWKKFHHPDLPFK